MLADTELRGLVALTQGELVPDTVWARSRGFAVDPPVGLERLLATAPELLDGAEKVLNGGLRRASSLSCLIRSLGDNACSSLVGGAGLGILSLLGVVAVAAELPPEGTIAGVE